jgi:hypothetical protein
MAMPPIKAKRRAQREYRKLLKEKERLEARLREIDEKLRSLYPTIELLDEAAKERYQEELKKVEAEKNALLSERERILSQLESINQKLSEMESSRRAWTRILKSIRIPLSAGKILVGLFSVIIAARIFTTADLFNQSFGIVPGILNLLDIHPTSELGRRMVLLLDFLLVETGIALFVYFMSRAFLLSLDSLFNAIGKTKYLVFIYAVLAMASFSLVFVIFFNLTLNY